MGDHRCAGSAVVTSHGVGYVGAGRKNCPEAFLKNGVVCSFDDSGVRVSTLCSSLPSEAVSFGSKMSLVNSMGFAQKKKGGKLWWRLQGGKKLVRHRAPKHGLGKDRHGHKSAVKDDDIDAVLSGISKESSIEECNSALIRLEKLSDEKALNFFDWMKVNVKLKGNAHAYHLALQAIVWKEDWKMAELLLREMVAFLVRAYGAVGRMHKVLPILQACFNKKILLDATSCSILVTSFVQNSVLEEALYILREKKWKDSAFEDNLYHILICSCKEGGSYNDAVRIYNQMPKSETHPNPRISCTMIDVFSRMERFADAEAIYLELKASASVLDMIAYSVIVRMYIKARRLEDACSILTEMEKQKELCLIQASRAANKFSRALCLIGVALFFAKFL